MQLDSIFTLNDYSAATAAGQVRAKLHNSQLLFLNTNLR
jgi:hypothetical protein